MAPVMRESSLPQGYLPTFGGHLARRIVNIHNFRAVAPRRIGG